MDRMVERGRGKGGSDRAWSGGKGGWLTSRDVLPCDLGSTSDSSVRSELYAWEWKFHREGHREVSVDEPPTKRKTGGGRPGLTFTDSTLLVERASDGLANGSESTV